MLGCAQQEIEAHVRGVTREQHTTTAIDSAKSQTHSAKPAVFGLFSPNGSVLWRPHPLYSRLRRHQTGGNCIIRAATRRRYSASQLLMLQTPSTASLKCAASSTNPWHNTGWCEETRPTSVKTPNLGCFGRAGRTLSHARRDTMATLKPPTPLQPLRQASMKPPSPLHAPEQQPLKPTSPLQPKNTPKTPVSHLQRRWRFQLRLDLRPQR